MTADDYLQQNLRTSLCMRRQSKAKILRQGHQDVQGLCKAAQLAHDILTELIPLSFASMERYSLMR